MNREKLNTLLNIKESFEMPRAMLGKLLSQEKNDFLEEIARVYDFSKDDFRDYFQTEHGDRDNLKQDYTPDCICKLLGGLSGEKKSWQDLCSGTGALSLSMADENTEEIILEELSARAIPVLICNLAIRNLNAYVLQKDIIANKIENVYKITKGEKFSDIQEAGKKEIDKTDLVISNPPYSLKWKPKGDDRFGFYTLPPSSKADFVFVIDGLRRLTENGRAFFILPHGILFRGNREGEIRKELIKKNVIDAVIGLPENLFLNTGIPVCVFCLKNNRESKDILVIDGSKLFKKEGKQNVMLDEHINKIKDAYIKRQNVEKLCSVVPIDYIEENDYTLNISRYVDTSEEKEKIDLGATIQELLQIDAEAKKNDRELAAMLREIEATDGNENYEKEVKPFIEWLEAR